jgi:hypothetical protein
VKSTEIRVVSYVNFLLMFDISTNFWLLHAWSLQLECYIREPAWKHQAFCPTDTSSCKISWEHISSSHSNSSYVKLCIYLCIRFFSSLPGNGRFPREQLGAGRLIWLVSYLKCVQDRIVVNNWNVLILCGKLVWWWMLIILTFKIWHPFLKQM